MINEKNIMMVGRQEICWLTRKTIDPLGEVFRYNGRLFRKIHDEKRLYVEEMFNNGLMHEMICKGFFVNTWIATDIQIKGEEKSLILEHEEVRHLSNKFEWSYGMFVEVRVMLAKFSIWLIKHGYELYDCHHDNVAFKGCKPIYLDLGSIVPLGTCGLEALNYYKSNWIIPFRLVEMFYGRECIEDDFLDRINACHTKLSYEELYALTGSNLKCKLVELKELLEYRLYDNKIKSQIPIVQETTLMLQNIMKIDDKKISKYKLKQYEKYSKFKCTKHLKKMVIDCYKDTDEANNNDDGMDIYVDWIKQLKNNKIVSSLQIADNSSLISRLLVENSLIEYACVLYSDMQKVDNDFMMCKNNVEIDEKISFSMRNIMKFSEHSITSTQERYKSDIVIATDIIQKLILIDKVKLSVVVDLLYKYTNQYIIVEFATSKFCEKDNGYTLDWFLDGLKEKFELINVEGINRDSVSVLGKKSCNLSIDSSR
jgi:hypothetical protein